MATSKGWAAVTKATRWLLAGGVLAFAACGQGVIEGGVGDPTVSMARFSLHADARGALTLADCDDSQGSCTKYPNPRGCDSLDVTVAGSGQAEGLCIKSNMLVARIQGALDGLPFVCGLDGTRQCLRCVDTSGQIVFDRCNSGAKDDVQAPAPEPPQGGGGQDPSDDISEPNAGDPNGSNSNGGSGTGSGSSGTGTGGNTTPSAPLPGANDPCSAGGIATTYASVLNTILRQEGLRFSYSPRMPDVGLNPFSFLGGFGVNVCGRSDSGLPLPGLGTTNPVALMGCDDDAEAQGRCYCHEQSGSATCRCARITYRVMAIVCTQLVSCSTAQTDPILWQVNSEANDWLNQYQGGSAGLAEATGPHDVMCQGSPLVLDTAGDGIELSSLDDGVPFALTSGVGRTSWVRGHDDALLVLDKNGNGRIDDGSELFGEAGGASDGFVALAQLDEPAFGGNGNGLLDRHDLMFAELQLWHDRNHDGVSQPGELSDLASHDIVAIELAAKRVGSIVDGHGNDLSLRARFFRKNGKPGVVADVLFLTAR